MEPILILTLLILLAVLSLRYGADSQADEYRFLSKEREVASYGLTWDHPAQPRPAPPAVDEQPQVAAEHEPTPAVGPVTPGGALVPERACLSRSASASAPL